MATAISIRGVMKSFPGARSPAVDRVGLEIGPGELFFLLGPSGCGKTTLLRMIAGFIEPDGGLIAFNGDDVTHVPPNKRGTGMVFQSYALWPHMTVEANVAFGLGVRRVPKPERDERVAGALAAVRMQEYAKRKPNQLSGGQQQRVALARALVIRPSVLLLDEPLSNLDAKLRIELRTEIRRICKESGITTVYVTHDQKEALSMADRVAVLDAGRVVQVGPPRDLYRRPATRFVAEFLGETNLIPGTLVERGPETAVVETSFGRLSAGFAGELAKGARVACSIRPEALTLGAPSAPAREDANRLSGDIIEATYLGELAQYTVELKGSGASMHAKVAQLNPAGVPDVEDGSRRPAALFVAPEDIAVLPIE